MTNFITKKRGKDVLLFPSHHSNIMSSRRKNKHPKRAENAKTVVVASAAEEERVGEGEGGARGPVLLCLRIPDDEQRNEIRKEKTTTTKGGKRKRGQHECDVCEKLFVYSIQVWRDTCVFTRTRDRTNAMCARGPFYVTSS